MTYGFVFSAAAALVLGGYIIGVKRYFSHYPPSLFVLLTYIIAIIWYLPVAVFVVPVEQLVPIIGIHSATVLLSTAGFNALALFAFYRSLAIGDVSYIAPISKIIPVFVLPLEVLLLGQRLSPLQVAGVVVTTAAVYVANYQQGSLLAPLFHLFQKKSALLALASAAAFAVVDIGKRVSMQELGIAPEGFVITMLILVATLISPSALTYRDAVDWWDDRRLLAIAGLTLVTGQHLVAVAFETLPASVVSPVVNTQAIIAVLLGSLLLDESHIPIRMTAAGLALLGIVLISLG